MLQHASLEVRPEQVDACVAFWRLLGFDRVEPPATLRDRAAWVERDGSQIHLMHVEDPVVAPEGHVAVVAPDYDGALDALRGAGFEPEPRTAHWGAPRCFVREPAGHRVEVMASPPPSPQ
jgi:catechol 2,3-dioxygenase-like lactoylglutathione lyase family enzyme